MDAVFLEGNSISIYNNIHGKLTVFVHVTRQDLISVGDGEPANGFP